MISKTVQARPAWIDDFVACLDVVDAGDIRIEEAFNIKAANLPPSVFKFRAVTPEALQNLADGTVWLAAPASFNDPFDSVVNLSGSELYRGDRTLMAPGAVESLEKYLDSEDWAAIDEADHLFREFSARLLAADSKIDPALRLRILDALDKIGAERTEEAFAPYLDLIRTTLKLCSFSAKYDPILMWSHYAAQHQGFCVEYETARMPEIAQRMLFPVIYREEMFDATRFHKAMSVDPKRFNNVYTVLPPLFKAPAWSYEEEWRLVFAGGVIPEPRAYGVGRPKAVYLGARMMPHGEQAVRQICDEMSVPVWRMRLARGRFQLEAIPAE